MNDALAQLWGLVSAGFLEPPHVSLARTWLVHRDCSTFPLAVFAVRVASNEP